MPEKEEKLKKEANKSHENQHVTLIQEGEDVLLLLPDEVWAQIGIDAGDWVSIESDDNEVITLKKADPPSGDPYN